MSPARSNLKNRIVMWAFAGLLIAVGWWFYITATVPTPITSTPLLWSIARLSCPIVLAGFYFHFGVSVYLTFVANAATYALIGLMVEGLRRQLHHAR
jgi:hypothetical protein